MEFWQTLVKNPSGEKTMDDFAIANGQHSKNCFFPYAEKCRMEKCKVGKSRSIEEEVLELKQQSGKDIFVGSRSLIIQLMKLNLIDEYQLCVHPVVAGSGLPLFENINDRTILKLIKTKTFSGGAVILYYEPTNEKTTNH